MFPILLKIGPLELYTYGLFMAIGFLAGIWFARREAVRLGEDPDRIADLSFFVLVAAIIGARLFYILTTPAPFLAHPLEMLKLWHGGLVFYGGFIAALATALVYVRIKRLPLLKIADIAAPAIALGHFFGRLGCLSAGCCYGRTCDLPWAITFSNPRGLAPLGVALYPTQIYSALANLSIFGILLFWRRYQRFTGQMFLVYVMLYGVIRSIIEIFRGDFRGQTILGIFSISQAIGLTLALAAAVTLVVMLRRSSSKANV